MEYELVFLLIKDVYALRVVRCNPLLFVELIKQFSFFSFLFFKYHLFD